MKLASVDAVDYYMYVPSSWTVADQDGITSAYVSIADKSNVTCARYTISNEATFEIPADKEESKPDAVVYAENYWTGYVTELEARLPGYRLISGPISTMLNGMPAVRCRYTATLSGVAFSGIWNNYILLAFHFRHKSVKGEAYHVFQISLHLCGVL